MKCSPPELDSPVPPQRVILVHKGALGDFLQVWPSLLALTRQWPETAFFWAGREDVSLWTEPLGIRPCPGTLKRLVNTLYSAGERPEGLATALVIWFGLRKRPFARSFPGVWFVRGLGEGFPAVSASPPRELYARGLAQLGVGQCRDWIQAWRRLIKAWNPGSRDGRRALLFPGAGNRNKCWPVEQFQALGEWLGARGWAVTCVYGPAEKERGVRVKNFEPAFPDDFQALQRLLVQADLVVGNDCGPLHLAGYLGVPGLALFGPADPKQWGPYGIKTVSRHLPCSPCTELGEVACSDPVCLRELSLERVQEAAAEVLSNGSACSEVK